MLLFCILVTVFLISSCKKSLVWGYEVQELIDKANAKDFLFLENIPLRRYKEIAVLGEGAFYIFGKNLLLAKFEDKAIVFFELGVQKEKSPYKELCQEEIQKINKKNQPQSPYDSLFQTLKKSNLYISQEEIKTLEKARSLLDTKHYQAAWALYKTILSSEQTYVFTREILSDACKSALYGEFSKEIDFLTSLCISEELSEEDFKEAEFIIRFYTARIMQRHAIGSPQEFYMQAIDLAQKGLDFDTALWYLLDSNRYHKEDFLSIIGRYAIKWHDPWWFADILDFFIVHCVQNNYWQTLIQLKENLAGNADPNTDARLAYLYAQIALFNPSLVQNEKDLFFEVFSKNHNSLYYRLLSAYELNIPFQTFTEEQKKIENRKNSQEQQDAFNQTYQNKEIVVCNFSNDFLKSMITWNLAWDLYALLKNCQSISLDVIIFVSDYLSNLGEHELALRIAVLGLDHTDNPLHTDLLTRIYPRPYSEYVEKYAQEFNIPETLLYALIRSESYFNAHAVSWAGAKGLCQLMDATAQDIAKKLRIENYDILDPNTNIQFGAFYLAELIQRLDGNQIEALFSYNAGISRLRTWKKSYGLLGPFLFLEALPYAETREYGRKVLVAASFYGYLYHQKNTKTTVQEIFGLF